MKIYVASKFERKDEVREVFKLLESLGHTITTDWTQHEYKFDDPNEAGFLRQCAMDDLFGVVEADVVILIPDVKGGAHFSELGIALGLCIPTLVVGFDKDKHARNIFYALSAIYHVKDINEAITTINGFQEKVKDTS